VQFEKLTVPTYFISMRGNNLTLPLSAGSEAVCGLHSWTKGTAIRRFVLQSGQSKWHNHIMQWEFSVLEELNSKKSELLKICLGNLKCWIRFY